jgi:hypothetical protein
MYLPSPFTGKVAPGALAAGRRKGGKPSIRTLKLKSLFQRLEHIANAADGADDFLITIIAQLAAQA